MSLSKKFLTSCVAVGLSLVSSSIFAQQNNAAQPNLQNQQNTVGQQSPGNQQVDAMFASCLILGNQNEIAASRLAEKNAKSDKVKSFAKMMVKDHSQFIDELSKFTTQTYRDRDLSDSSSGSSATGNANRTGSDNRTTATDNRTAGSDNRAAGTDNRTSGTVNRTAQSTVAVDSNNPWALQAQIDYEIANECLASARKELTSKQGSEFDECYIGMQIGEHMKMVDKLKVLERHASPSLVSVLKEGRETAEKHLEHAKDIKKSLASNSDSRDSQSSDSKASSSKASSSKASDSNSSDSKASDSKSRESKSSDSK